MTSKNPHFYGASKALGLRLPSDPDDPVPVNRCHLAVAGVRLAGRVARATVVAPLAKAPGLGRTKTLQHLLGGAGCRAL